MGELQCENELEIVHFFPNHHQTPHISSLKLVIVYLHPGNQQMLQMRAFPPKQPVVKQLAARHQLW